MGGKGKGKGVGDKVEEGSGRGRLWSEGGKRDVKGEGRILAALVLFESCQRMVMGGRGNAYPSLSRGCGNSIVD